MGGLDVCKIFLVLGALTRHGFGTDLDLTVTPTKTSQLSSEDVAISCHPGTSLQSIMAILVIKITKSGESSPLASVLPNHQAVSYSPNTNTNKTTSAIEAMGNIDDHNLLNSFLTLTLKDPTFKQSGSYECEVTYLDVKGKSHIAKSYTDVKVTKPDIVTINRVIDDLRKEIDESNQASSSRDQIVKAVINRLTKQEVKISQMKTEFLKSLQLSEKQSSKQIESLKAIDNDLKKRLDNQAVTIRKNSQTIVSDRKLLKAVTDELNETKAKLQNKKVIKCPNESWKRVDDDSCYKLHKTGATWAEARDTCHKDGGTLVTILHKLHYNMANSMARLAGIERYWIGLNDIGMEGKFVFDSGVPLTSFRPWYVTQPDNAHNEDCVEQRVIEDAWNDWPCGLKLPFMCEAGTRIVDFW